MESTWFFHLSPLIPNMTSGLGKPLKLSVLPIFPFARRRNLGLCYNQHEGKREKVIRTSGVGGGKYCEEKNRHAHTKCNLS